MADISETLTCHDCKCSSITVRILKQHGMGGCVRVWEGIPAAPVTPDIITSFTQWSHSAHQISWRAGGLFSGKGRERSVTFNHLSICRKHWVFPWWLFQSLEGFKWYFPTSVQNGLDTFL